MRIVIGILLFVGMGLCLRSIILFEIDEFKNKSEDESDTDA